MIVQKYKDMLSGKSVIRQLSEFATARGAEIGYEFTFKNHNSLGIGVYGNYSLYSLYKKNDQSSSIIDIAEAPSSGKNAVVTVIPATDAYGKGVGYFDVGLKLAYHFNWWKEVIK